MKGADKLAYAIVNLIFSALGVALIAWGTESWATGFGALLIAIYARLPGVRTFMHLEAHDRRYRRPD